MIKGVERSVKDRVKIRLCNLVGTRGLLFFVVFFQLRLSRISLAFVIGFFHIVRHSSPYDSLRSSTLLGSIKKAPRYGTGASTGLVSKLDICQERSCPPRGRYWKVKYFEWIRYWFFTNEFLRNSWVSRLSFKVV